MTTGYLERQGRRGYLAREIVLLLAALSQGGSITIMSLLRPGHSQHGVSTGNGWLTQAIDIAAYQGRLIKLQTNEKLDAYLDPGAPANTHLSVTGVLSRLPKLPGNLQFGIGLPRASSRHGGPDVPEALRLYLPRPTDATVRGVRNIKPAFAYKGTTLPNVRQDVANAIAASPAGRVAWVNGDGFDHIHIQVERKNKPEKVYQDAAFKPVQPGFATAG